MRQTSISQATIYSHQGLQGQKQTEIPLFLEIKEILTL